MSYCRFSSNDYACDVYVYEDAVGGYMTHVAACRYRFDEPLPPPVPFEHEDEWVARMVQVQKLAESAPRDPITLPYAGSTFTDATPAALLRRLEELAALGYRIPSYVFDELRAERDAA